MQKQLRAQEAWLHQGPRVQEGVPYGVRRLRNVGGKGVTMRTQVQNEVQGSSFGKGVQVQMLATTGMWTQMSEALLPGLRPVSRSGKYSGSFNA